MQGVLIQCSVTTFRGRMGWEVGGKFKREGTYIYLWLIHVDVWQKPTQYCNYPPIKNKRKNTWSVNLKYDLSKSGECDTRSSSGRNKWFSGAPGVGIAPPGVGIVRFNIVHQGTQKDTNPTENQVIISGLITQHKLWTWRTDEPTLTHSAVAWEHLESVYLGRHPYIPSLLIQQ